MYKNKYFHGFKNNNCEYFNKYKRTNLISDLVFFYKKYSFNFLSFSKKEFSICGRIFSKRIMGKSIFVDIKDSSGKLQIYISKNNFLETYESLISYLNLGDIVGVNGYLFLTKTNELSLNANHFVILSKNLLSFPDKRFGLLDREVCYRQRYLDLIVNDKSKNKFFIRAKTISKVREFFISNGFLEVETPILQSIPGGAEAEPFETYHNTLDSKMYLRISPELYLKRLIVGGFEKVFEIGKIFRNEGISTKHHPEFTTIEFYAAYFNYKDLIYLTEILLKFLVKSLFSQYFFYYNNFLIDFSIPFKKIDFLDSLELYTSITKLDLFNKEKLKFYLNENNIKYNELDNIYILQNVLFENFVEKKLLNPTFILHHPVEISPLARKIDENKNFTERFELYIYGMEIANGFSELNDPVEQNERFENQLKKNNDNKCIDFDFINSLKYGLPPTAGEGIGIDRLVMLFTNSLSIKDVIFFPFMKSKI